MSDIPEKTIPQREPRPDKVEQVERIAALLERSSGVLLTDYRGITVSEKADLTRRLRAAGAEFHVVKNSLFRLAYEGRGESVDEMLAGPTAVAFALEDPVGPSKVLLDFLRETRKGVLKGGIVEGRVYDPDAVRQLSTLPPKAQLLAEIIGSIQAPLTDLVFTLQGAVSEFLLTLQAIADQQGGGESPAEA